MTVVATALRVDDIAAETDEGGIQVSKIERHRRELESVQHATVEVLAIVEILGVAVSDAHDPDPAASTSTAVPIRSIRSVRNRTTSAVEIDKAIEPPFPLQDQ